jgi:transposase
MLKTNTAATTQAIADRQELLDLPHGQLVDLVLMMRAQIAELSSQVTELRSQVAALHKNSTNSSKPPSSDMPGSGGKGSNDAASRKHLNSRNPSGRKPGGQSGHTGTTRTTTTTPDKVVVCAPANCGNCGHSLVGASATDTIMTMTQVADIPPIVPIITEYQQIARTCACGHTTSGTLPEGIAASGGTIQIGPNASSLLVYLNTAHHLPYARLQQIAADLFHLSLSQGSIDNKLEVAAVAAAPLRECILTFLHGSSQVGSDETGVRVAGKRIWEWVWQNTKASFYAISSHRDYQTVNDNFGEDYQGVLVHDCYSAQNNTKAKAGHQLCHAHLLRDLQFVVDTERSVWAYQMQIFLLRAQRARDHIWAEGFDLEVRRQIQADYERQLDKIIRQSVTSKETIRLQKRFKKHQEKILRFMNSPDIPPDNNGSERAIRNAKVKQKVSGGYRSLRGAERQAILLSVIETAKKQDLNVLAIIRKLMCGEAVQLFGGE